MYTLKHFKSTARSTATSFLFLLIVASVQAQLPVRHEWGVFLGGARSTWLSGAVAGSYDSGGLGGVAGANFTEYLSTHWGVEVGAEAAWYYNVASIDRIVFTTLQDTPTGLSGNFYRTDDYTACREQQQAWYVQAPVRIVFRTSIGKQNLYTSGGFKAAFPLSGSERTTVRTLTVTGYSDYTGQTYADMPGHGFETQNDVDRTVRPSLPSLYMLSLETGIQWRLSSQKSLSAGVCFDYGKVASHIQPIAFGLKLKISAGYGKTKTKRLKL
jgi:hypothetical protein